MGFIYLFLIILIPGIFWFIRVLFTMYISSQSFEDSWMEESSLEYSYSPVLVPVVFASLFYVFNTPLFFILHNLMYKDNWENSTMIISALISLGCYALPVIPGAIIKFIRDGDFLDDKFIARSWWWGMLFFSTIGIIYFLGWVVK